MRASRATAAVRCTEANVIKRDFRVPALVVGGFLIGIAAGVRGVAAPDAPFYANTFEKVPSAAAMTGIGRALFLDKSLSASGKLACASCHDPARSFGPPND